MLICHYTDERKSDFEKLLANSECNVYALTDEDSLCYKVQKRKCEINE